MSISVLRYLIAISLVVGLGLTFDQGHVLIAGARLNLAAINFTKAASVYLDATAASGGTQAELSRNIFQKASLEQAVARVQRLAAQQPQRASLAHLRAAGCVLLECSPAEIETASQAAQAASAPLFTYGMLGDYLFSIGDLAGAPLQWQKVMGTEEAARRTFRTAREFLAGGRTSEAQTLFDMVVRLEPQDPNFYYEMAWIRLRAGPPDDRVRELFEKGLARDASESAQRYRVQGLHNLWWGSPGEAARSLGRVVELKPQEPWPRVEYADALIQSGQLDAAETQLLEALRLEPGLYQPHGYLAQIYEAQGRVQEAVRAREEAVRCNPSWIYGRLRLAQYHEATGQLSAAITQYRAILDLDPGNVDAAAALQRLQSGQ